MLHFQDMFHRALTITQNTARLPLCIGVSQTVCANGDMLPHVQFHSLLILIPSTVTSPMMPTVTVTPGILRLAAIAGRDSLDLTILLR